MPSNQVILVQKGATYNVSTLTPLATLDTRKYGRILVSLQNPSVSDPVSLVVDPGTDSGKYDTGLRQVAVAAPGEEAHLEVATLCPTLRIQAQTDSPYPTVNNVTFEVRAECPTPGIQDWTLRNVAGSSIP